MEFREVEEEEDKEKSRDRKRRRRITFFKKHFHKQTICKW